MAERVAAVAQPVLGDLAPVDFPTGWFHVAWSAELPSKGVVPLQFMGRELVLYRGEDGRPVALDAHCAHMGAHLGHGGTVEGTSIRCPFHGWRWDDAGANVEIPYGDQGCVRASLRSWPALEVGSFIYVWNDSAGGMPTWQPPTIPEEVAEDYYPLWPEAVHHERLRTEPQALAENAADAAHLRTVHRWADIPHFDLVEEEGHIFRTIFTGTMSTPKGPITETISNDCHGVGIVVSRMRGVTDLCIIGTATPVDAERCDIRLSLFVERPPGESGPKLGRLAKAVVAAQGREVLGPNGDRRIWEHMARDRRPILLAAEGEIKAIRRWARQFYATAPAGASEATVA